MGLGERRNSYSGDAAAAVYDAAAKTIQKHLKGQKVRAKGAALATQVTRKGRVIAQQGAQVHGKLVKQMSLGNFQIQRKRVVQQGTLAQSEGAVGEARMIDAAEDIPIPVLVNRLVALAPSQVWGEGHLLRLAEESKTDEELQEHVKKLLERNWREDPLRRRELARILRNGRRLSLGESRPVLGKRAGPGSMENSMVQGAASAVDAAAEAVSAVAEAATDAVSGAVSCVAAAAERLVGRDEPTIAELPSTSEAASVGAASEDQGSFGAAAPAEEDAKEGKTWGDVLADGRGAVGETVLKTWGDVLVDGRGAVGETVLHLLFLLNTDECRRLIRILVPYLAKYKTVDAFPPHKVGCLDCTYTAQPYYGEVAMHFAIVHHDLEMVELLVKNGAHVNARACGDFFYSNRKLYFGGTLLGFAACLDNKPIVEYLLTNQDCRANPNGRDHGPQSKLGVKDWERQRPKMQEYMHRGNSVLHCLVLHEKAEMYRYLCQMGANSFCVNFQNQTPLLLAAQSGSKKMVEAAMESTHQMLWSFGPVKCVKVPLYEVESIKEAQFLGETKKRDSRFSSLSTISKKHNGETEEPEKRRKTILQEIESDKQSDLLYIETLWSVVSGKWDCFARSIFIYFSALNFVSLISQTLALCTLVEGNDTCTIVLYLGVVPVPIRDVPAVVGDAAYVLTLFIALFLLMRYVTTMRRLDRSWLYILEHGMPELLSCSLQYVSIAFRFDKDLLPINRLLLGLTSCLGWIRFMRNTFNYSPKLGPLLKMVFRMLGGDVAQWLILYSCFFASFQSLLLGLMLGDGGGIDAVSLLHDGSETQTILYAAKVLFRFTVNPDTSYFIDAVGGWPNEWNGTGDEESPYSGRDLNPTTWFFVGIMWISLLLWILLGSVVLLNLLIAMMGSTYAQLYKKSEAEWRFSFWQLVLTQEATPRCFVPPLRRFDVKNRPPNHVRGNLQIMTTSGAEAEVECWFLTAELDVDQDGEQDPQARWLEKQELRGGTPGTTVSDKQAQLIADEVERRFVVLQENISQRVHEQVERALRGFPAEGSLSSMPSIPGALPMPNAQAAAPSAEPQRPKAPATVSIEESRDTLANWANEPSLGLAC